MHVIVHMDRKFMTILLTDLLAKFRGAYGKNSRGLTGMFREWSSGAANPVPPCRMPGHCTGM